MSVQGLENALLNCISFDQDAFLDIRMTAAEKRQKEWESGYLPGVSGNVEVIYRRMKDETQQVVLAKEDEEILEMEKVTKIHLLGSSQDGLFLEKSFPVVDLGTSAVNETDLDIVFEFEGVDIKEDESAEDAIPTLYVEDGLHPGYVMLRIRRNNGNEAACGENLYFDPLALKKELQILLKNSGFFVYTNMWSGEILPDGPALHGAFEDELGIHFLDYVSSLSMKKWPKVAQSFLRRRRPSGWPTAEIVEEVTRMGCGFVAVGYKGSETEQLEWRISFSATERLLIRKLDRAQIRAYLFLKTLYKIFLTEPDCLSTYMIKNILLWVVEMQPLGIWRSDNIFHCVEVLLGRLVHHLGKGFLPNYFVEKRNMLGPKNRNEVRQLHQKAMKIQKDVLGAIIQCSQSSEFKGLCDVSLTLLSSEMAVRPGHITNKVLCLLYYLMYLNIRLQALRYQIKLSLSTFLECKKTCRSLYQPVVPRAAWYLIEAIKIVPDPSYMRLYVQDDQLILDMFGFREAAARFIFSSQYEGLLKKVLTDQEFVSKYAEAVTVLPEFDTLIDWVDMTSIWSGGMALNSEHTYVPDELA